MGGADWEGIGQGAGDIGRAVVAHRERTLEERERKTEKQTALDEEQRERQYRAAEAAWRMTQHLPEGDPQREQAAANYESAARAYFKSQTFAIPKKTVGAKPAVTAPRDPKEGEPAGANVITSQGAQPGRQVYDIPGAAQQQVDEEQVLGVVRQLQNGIANARMGAARSQALAQADAWKKAVLAKYPQVAHLLPDFSQTAQMFNDEDQRQAAARVAAEGAKKWEAAAKASQTQLESAMKGNDPLAVIAAVKARRQLAAAGKAAGYTASGAFDEKAQLAEVRNILTAWAAKVTDARTLLVIEPILAQYGIKLTKPQQELLGYYRKTQQKAAAPRAPRQAAPKPEDTGF